MRVFVTSVGGDDPDISFDSLNRKVNFSPEMLDSGESSNTSTPRRPKPHRTSSSHPSNCVPLPSGRVQNARFAGVHKCHTETSRMDIVEAACDPVIKTVVEDGKDAALLFLGSSTQHKVSFCFGDPLRPKEELGVVSKTIASFVRAAQSRQSSHRVSVRLSVGMSNDSGRWIDLLTNNSSCANTGLPPKGPSTTSNSSCSSSSSSGSSTNGVLSSLMTPLSSVLETDAEPSVQPPSETRIASVDRALKTLDSCLGRAERSGIWNQPVITSLVSPRKPGTSTLNDESNDDDGTPNPIGIRICLQLFQFKVVRDDLGQPASVQGGRSQLDILVVDTDSDHLNATNFSNFLRRNIQNNVPAAPPKVPGDVTILTMITTSPKLALTNLSWLGVAADLTDCSPEVKTKMPPPLPVRNNIAKQDSSTTASDNQSDDNETVIYKPKTLSDTESQVSSSRRTSHSQPNRSGGMSAVLPRKNKPPNGLSFEACKDDLTMLRRIFNKRFPLEMNHHHQNFPHQNRKPQRQDFGGTVASSGDEEFDGDDDDDDDFRGHDESLHCFYDPTQGISTTNILLSGPFSGMPPRDISMTLPNRGSKHKKNSSNNDSDLLADASNFMNSSSSQEYRSKRWYAKLRKIQKQKKQGFGVTSTPNNDIRASLISHSTANSEVWLDGPLSALSPTNPSPPSNRHWMRKLPAPPSRMAQPQLPSVHHHYIHHVPASCAACGFPRQPGVNVCPMCQFSTSSLDSSSDVNNQLPAFVTPARAPKQRDSATIRRQMASLKMASTPGMTLANNSSTPQNPILLPTPQPSSATTARLHRKTATLIDKSCPSGGISNGSANNEVALAQTNIIDQNHNPTSNVGQRLSRLTDTSDSGNDSGIMVRGVGSSGSNSSDDHKLVTGAASSVTTSSTVTPSLASSSHTVMRMPKSHMTTHV